MVRAKPNKAPVASIATSPPRDRVRYECLVDFVGNCVQNSQDQAFQLAPLLCLPNPCKKAAPNRK
jgi:hypothetical protein